MILYRYSTNLYDSQTVKKCHVGGYLNVYIHEYNVIRETPCGGWIIVRGGDKKFVNLQAVKQYASKTPEIAKTCFLARKKRQLKILRAQIGLVEEAIELLDTPLEDFNQYMHFDIYCE